MPGQRLILIRNTTLIILILADLKSSQSEVSAIKPMYLGYVFNVSFDEMDGGDFYFFDGLNADEDEQKAVGGGWWRENVRLEGVEKRCGSCAGKGDALFGQDLGSHLLLRSFLFVREKLQGFRVLLG